MATNQRSRSAILRGAKIVITEVGSYESNMVDIAARAEVSRATVYNHFSDKEEMMLTLLESEIQRLFEIAKNAPSCTPSCTTGKNSLELVTFECGNA